MVRVFKLELLGWLWEVHGVRHSKINPILWFNVDLVRGNWHWRIHTYAYIVLQFHAYNYTIIHTIIACMYVCMYIIYIHTYIYTRIYIYIYIYSYVKYTHTYIIYIYIYLRVCVYLCVCIYIYGVSWHWSIYPKSWCSILSHGHPWLGWGVLPHQR